MPSATLQTAITLLQPGATPTAPWTTAGSFNFDYGPNWEHNTIGMTARPGTAPGTYDLVFNIGSEFNDQLSTDKVALTGLTQATLTGDSLYAVTIDETGASPSASKDHPTKKTHWSTTILEPVSTSVSRRTAYPA
jgi:hypothetical protein